MKCRVIKPFNRRGELQLPGSILDVPDEMIARLEGLVQLVVDSSVDSYSPDNWKPPFRAWLEGDELRTTGVCDDLAVEIIKLTSDNLLLQAKLCFYVSMLGHTPVHTGCRWFEDGQNGQESCLKLKVLVYTRQGGKLPKK